MLEPIIICGPGHSGTTALARYLGTASGWKNYLSGIPAHMAVLECLELLHPTADERICVPRGPTEDVGRGEAIRSICESDPEMRFIFKRPWIERDPEWCLREFPWAIFLVMFRPFISCWQSWNKPGSIRGCGLHPDGPLEDGWKLWSAQMSGAARLIAGASKAAFVDHSSFTRNPAIVDYTLTQWGIFAEFNPNEIKPRL